MFVQYVIYIWWEYKWHLMLLDAEKKIASVASLMFDIIYSNTSLFAGVQQQEELPLWSTLGASILWESRLRRKHWQWANETGR